MLFILTVLCSVRFSCAQVSCRYDSETGGGRNPTVGHSGSNEGVMEGNAVVDRLREFGRTRGDSDWSALDKETKTLMRRDSFAFLVAVAFDRGMLWE